MWRTVLLVVAVLTLCAAGSGCAKRVPWEGPLEARRTVVLVFADGSEVRGKINTDETVEYTSAAGVYSGVIDNVTDQEIELRNCRFVRDRDTSLAEQQRLSQARIDLGVENIESVILQRADIVSTDHVKVDALKTAARSVFWVLAGMTTALLIQEKS